MKEDGSKMLEVMGTIDEQHQLHLDAPLPLSGPSRVRVILVFPEEADVADMDEKEWLRAAGQNPAFDFLKDPAEDRYTLRDGKPFLNDNGRSCSHKYSSKPGGLRHL